MKISKQTQSDWDALARVFAATRPKFQTPNRYTWNNVLDTTVDLFRSRYGLTFDAGRFYQLAQE